MSEKRKNIIALSTTVGVHLLLLLLFILFKYDIPAYAQPEEMGMEVNLGTTDNAGGDEQPGDIEDPASVNIPDLSSSGTTATDLDKELLTEDAEENTNIVAKQKAKNKTNTPQVQPNKNKTPKAANNNTSSTAKTSQPTPPQKPKYTYDGASGRGGNSASENMAGTNEGIGKGAGDMGVPGGTPGASNYSGTPGKGNMNYNHTISGRSLRAYPSKEAKYREGGRVVIRVTVNKAGDIVASRVESSSNNTIKNIALQKLKAIKFNASSTAPAEQFGNIVFEFKSSTN